MKILICTFTFPPDSNGVAAVTAAHALHMMKSGHDVTVATGITNGDMPSSEFDKIKIMRFDVTGNARLGNIYRGQFKEYVDFVRNWDGDIAFFHCWCIWSTDLLLPYIDDLKFKTVIVSHGFNAQRYPQNKRFPRGLRHWLGWLPYVLRLPRRLRAISQLVVLSHSTDPRWYYDHHVARKIGMQNLSVIPSGIHLDEFDSARISWNNEPGITTSRMVLVIGNYFPQHKNQAYALRSYALSKPEDCTLLFIGSQFNEYSSFLKSESERLGISNNVRICAGLPRKTVCAAYLKADLVLCSSLWESGPIVLLESMAAGVPFISTDVGFARFLQGGVIVDSENSMASEINRLLADNNLSRELGAAGRAQCQREYSWEAVMKSYDALLARLSTPAE